MKYLFCLSLMLSLSCTKKDSTPAPDPECGVYQYNTAPSGVSIVIPSKPYKTYKNSTIGCYYYNDNGQKATVSDGFCPNCR